MSDLSHSLEALARSRTQLPVSSYFDAESYRRELELIFQLGPRYIGHELAVSEVGDHHTLPQEGDGRALVRTHNGVELISNVCRHRQAVILRGRGRTQGHIVCPLHRWTYDLQGHLIGAPHFERDFIDAQQAAYTETCEEDDEIALRMDAGRKALLERGDDEVGPYQSPMEDGMQQFHEWYRRQMQGTVAAAP